MDSGIEVDSICGGDSFTLRVLSKHLLILEGLLEGLSQLGLPKGDGHGFESSQWHQIDILILLFLLIFLDGYLELNEFLIEA